MRADRLVAVLLMLQRRGQVTAADVATELEVSVRTARRDLEALGMAGLPVYSTAGRGGGWQLLGGGTTDLSGLSEPEAIGVFALIGSSGAVGASQETRAALRKLARALPATMRDAAERAASSIRVTEGQPPTPGSREVSEDLVSDVRRSVVLARRAELSYAGRDGELSHRTVEPWGLVGRGGRWYLVAGTARGQRTFRLDRILDYRITDADAERPESFDLDEAWARIEATIDELRWSARVQVRIVESAVDRVSFRLGDRLVLGGPSAAPEGDALDGPAGVARERYVEAAVRGWSEQELVSILAGFHPLVLVDGPPQARARLVELGAALVRDHGGR